MAKRIEGLCSGVLCAAMLLLVGRACGQVEEKEPVAIVELGAASESVVHGATSFGPSIAVEATPIENRLELEAGVTPFISHGQVDWHTDFLFKKPFNLAKTVEFMFGVGPEWDHTRLGGRSSDVFSAEAAGDFMFWPWPKRRFGLYAEPSYAYSFDGAHEQSISVSFGLLIPIYKR
jgi:hypothetical protein